VKEGFAKGSKENTKKRAKGVPTIHGRRQKAWRARAAKKGLGLARGASDKNGGAGKDGNMADVHPSGIKEEAKHRRTPNTA